MRAIIFVALGLSLGGCTVIPHLEEDGIAIAHIVQRVKCELAYAVPDFRGHYPSGDYQWMRYWTAKVDLTLDVNDLSSVKPNSSYVTPVSQGTFSIGATGELSTQAQRVEKLSFTLSMNELVENRNNTNCLLPFQLGLLGNLGLHEWVVSALAPTETGQLKIGYHQPPNGKTNPIPGPATVDASQEPGYVSPAKRLLKEAFAALQKGENGTKLAREAALRARALALQSKFQATYDAVDAAYGYVEATSKLLEKANNLAWQATVADRDAKEQKDKLQGSDPDLLKKIQPAAKEASDEVAKAKATAKAAWELLPRDAPIDSITHTAKFVVTLGGSVTPNWTLVKFKGPGLTAPFAAASRVRTNQLDVVLGMPAVAGGKELSDEQRRQLFDIQLDSLRRSLVVFQ
ncbi:hypothetical protein V1283_002648 [Bradyrhizobium sp. AZCC 2262]|uniref:hypothetical protein n=1 Tax=Bradyrhizobium sp. AZCC 2262 TaxID=3117022 RepID=UPI002FF0DE1C